MKQIGRELGVRYVLEGSVRRVTDRIRITGQLIDAVFGAHFGLSVMTANLMTYSRCKTK